MKKLVNSICELKEFSTLKNEGYLNVPTQLSSIEKKNKNKPNSGIVIKCLGARQAVSWPFYKPISKIL